MNDENNSFSIVIPGGWRIPDLLEDNIFDLLKNLLKFKSENNIELNIQAVRKKGTQIKTGYKEYKLSKIVTFKNEVLEELKNVNYNDLEDMV